MAEGLQKDVSILFSNVNARFSRTLTLNRNPLPSRERIKRPSTKIGSITLAQQLPKVCVPKIQPSSEAAHWKLTGDHFPWIIGVVWTLMLTAAADGSPVPIFIIGSIEIAFFIYNTMLANSANVPPQPESMMRDLMELWENCLIYSPEGPKGFVEGWFYDSPLDTIAKEDLQEFLAWGSCSTTWELLTDSSKERMLEVYTLFEQHLEHRFSDRQPGQAPVACMRFSIEPFEYKHTPTMYYWVCTFFLGLAGVEDVRIYTQRGGYENIYATPCSRIHQHCNTLQHVATHCNMRIYAQHHAAEYIRLSDTLHTVRATVRACSFGCEGCVYIYTHVYYFSFWTCTYMLLFFGPRRCEWYVITHATSCSEIHTTLRHPSYTCTRRVSDSPHTPALHLYTSCIFSVNADMMHTKIPRTHTHTHTHTRARTNTFLMLVAGKGALWNAAHTCTPFLHFVYIQSKLIYRAHTNPICMLVAGKGALWNAGFSRLSDTPHTPALDLYISCTFRANAYIMHTHIPRTCSSQARERSGTLAFRDTAVRRWTTGSASLNWKRRANAHPSFLCTASEWGSSCTFNLFSISSRTTARLSVCKGAAISAIVVYVF